MRCGILEDELLRFLDSRKTELSMENLKILSVGFLTLEHIGEYVFKNDDSFSEFLFKKGVSEQIYYGAIGWIMRVNVIRGGGAEKIWEE